MEDYAARHSIEHTLDRKAELRRMAPSRPDAAARYHQLLTYELEGLREVVHTLRTTTGGRDLQECLAENKAGDRATGDRGRLVRRPARPGPGRAGRMKREILLLVGPRSPWTCCSSSATSRSGSMPLGGAKIGYTAAWTVVTLLVVLRGLARIRARRGREAGLTPKGSRCDGGHARRTDEGVVGRI